MTDTSPRRGGGRAARQAARLAAHTETVPYLTRTLSPVEVLSDEGAELIEQNADTILEQVGVIFRDYPEALSLLGDARRRRRRRPRALPPRHVPAASCPRRRPSVYTQHARNPARSRADRR